MKKISLAVLLLTCSSFASADWLDQVRSINRDLAREAGYYTESHNIKYDSMREGGRESYSVRLDRGLSYKIYGDCDTDCHDMDLYLYDDRGRIVARDEEDDDSPILNYTPRYSGKYELVARIPRCDANPCRYAIQIFSR